jgi:putative transposase
MSRAGNCYDNAKMESFWATLKSELIGERIFASHAEAKSEIFHYIEVFYNRARLHGALGFYSPVDFENQLN